MFVLRSSTPRCADTYMSTDEQLSRNSHIGLSAAAVRRLSCNESRHRLHQNLQAMEAEARCLWSRLVGHSVRVVEHKCSSLKRLDSAVGCSAKVSSVPVTMDYRFVQLEVFALGQLAQNCQLESS